MKISKILEGNEKKVYIDAYLPDGEVGEDGKLKEVEFVTIKKLPFLVKKKILFLSMNSMSGKTTKHIFQAMKKQGLKPDNMQELTDDQKYDLMLDMQIEPNAAAEMEKMTVEITKSILEHGIKESGHTLFGEDDKPIVINYDFWIEYGNTELVDFLVSEIKDFSSGILPGK